MNLKQTIRRVLKEEDYSPAGKEIIPNNIVIHKSNPMFRDKIKEDGLKVRAGECYKIYVGYGTKCRPAIFATNSTNKRAWFDSTYDDDIWEINTEMIPDVKWYKDRHYESRSKHIVTFQDIPKEAITLKYEGTGSGDVKLWNKDSPNIVKESIRRILREETNSKEISSYLDITPFYKLPYSYQKSLMIMRNEGTTTDVEIKDLIDDELQTSLKRKMFYYGVVPIKLIEDEVTERLEWDSFENYHKWYGDEQTDHGDSVLPIIIDFDDEELIIDGWHRFHSYVRKGLNKVPVLGIYRD